MHILPLDVWSEIYKQAPAELGALRAVNKTARDAVDEVGRLAVQNLSQEVQERWIAFFQTKFSKKNPDVVKERFLAGKFYSLMEKHKSRMNERALCMLAEQNPTIISATGDAEAIRAWLEQNKDRLAALDTLKLDCTDMEALPLELLVYFPNIKQLKLKNLKVADEILGAFQKLKTLDLFMCPLTTLPASLGTSNLTYLKMDWGTIKTLPKEIYHAQNAYIRGMTQVLKRRFFPLLIASLIIGILLCLFGLVATPLLLTPFLPIALAYSLSLTTVIVGCLLTSLGAGHFGNDSYFSY